MMIKSANTVKIKFDSCSASFRENSESQQATFAFLKSALNLIFFGRSKLYFLAIV